MRTKMAVILAGVGYLAVVAPAWAHHAFAAEFDSTKPVKLRGKVTNWMVEGGSPNALIRRGFTKDALPVGTEIVADGYQAKDGSARANGRDITFPDGRKIFVGGSNPDEQPNYTPSK